ncbi:junctional sarcoplasmic reticulum protein 1 [Platysternon megacephalum]|uniref:Junctional sarcoplasmic reticulum protein 1 n=1 Tax=Platysternon megacephalum TaxID=55544 RepID=A0A4D9DP62_9SAUR|nr:junctional sarcoplasmic reticulum protein 1 [Platysternon megacephalum]
MGRSGWMSSGQVPSEHLIIWSLGIRSLVLCLNDLQDKKHSSNLFSTLYLEGLSSHVLTVCPYILGYQHALEQAQFVRNQPTKSKVLIRLQNINISFIMDRLK